MIVKTLFFGALACFNCLSAEAKLMELSQCFIFQAVCYVPGQLSVIRPLHRSHIVGNKPYLGLPEGQSL